MRRVFLFSIALLIATAPVVAKDRKKKKEPPLDPELVELVEPLLKKLDDASFEVREEATQELLEIGPKVTPVLERAEDRASPEVRMRVRRVLLQFREIARRAALGGPETGDWPMLKRGPNRGASTGSALRKRPEVRWFRPLPAVVGRPYFDAPLVAGRKRLYAVTRSGQISAVDLKTGEIVWARETGQRTHAGPVLGGGRLFVPGPALVTMDADSGRELWRWKTDYGVIASPLVVGDVVYAVEKGEKLVALDTRTGEQKWKKRLLATSSAPVLVGDLLLIGTERGVMAIHAESGTRRWLSKTVAPVTTSPALLTDRLVVGDSDRHIYALSLTRGKQLWRRRIPEGRVHETPTVFGDAVFFSTTGSMFRAIRASDGGDVWTRWAGTVIQSSPCVADGVVYFVADSVVRALECVNGDDVWRLDLMESCTSPILVEGSMFLLGLDGVLISLK